MSPDWPPAALLTSDWSARVFEEAIEAAEGGALGWLKTINSFRIVRLLTYPAKIPLNVAMVSWTQ